MSRKEPLIAASCEGFLILVAALAGWVSHQPLVFASLGPTAFELIETPKRPSARPYNVIVGHLIAVLSAFIALWLTHAWHAPTVSAAGVTLPRVWAVVLAAFLTVLGTLLARATQPAAVATTLLIAAGLMQTLPDGVLIMAAVVLMTASGEPIRRWRARTMPEEKGK